MHENGGPPLTPLTPAIEIPAHRATVIHEMRTETKLDAKFRRVVQRGRDPETAEFLLELDDGRLVKLGTFDGLWSQARFAKALAVATGYVPETLKPGDWRKHLAALLAHATDIEDVEDVAGEAEDVISLYLRHKGEHVPDDGTDVSPEVRANAADQLAAFRFEGDLHIHPQDLANFVRRVLGEQGFKLSQARTILRDAGYTPVRVTFDRAGDRSQRTTARYYAGKEPGSE